MSGTTTTTSSIPSPLDPSVLDALLSIAERAVEQATARGADSAEAFIMTDSGQSVSVEKDAVGFTSSGGEAGLGIRVLKQGRGGFAYCSSPDDAADAAERALAVAAKAEPSNLQLPGPAALPTVSGLWDDTVAHYDIETALAAVKDLVGGAKAVHENAVVSGGAVGVGVEASALVNSEGVAVGHRSTGIGLSAYVVLKEGDQVTTGFKSHAATRLAGPVEDPAAVGREAAEQAKACLGATPLGKEGPTTVVFAPDATAALLEFCALPALYGDKAARGESIWSGKLGQDVVDPRLRLVDDPTLDGGLGSAPADDEGLPSRRVDLLADGQVRSYLYDLGTAYEHGGGPDAATASAIRTGGLSDGRTYQDGPTLGARNATLSATDARRLDDVINEVGDGILVHDLLGAHTANPTSGDFSVSSTVLFHIRDGALAEAVSGAMLAGNLPSLLQVGYRGASTETETTSGHFSPVGLEMPYLALDGVHVVGS